VFPLPSAPWHKLHFALNNVAASSAARAASGKLRIENAIKVRTVDFNKLVAMSTPLYWSRYRPEYTPQVVRTLLDSLGLSFYVTVLRPLYQLSDILESGAQ
jgi:hypothetical protein